MKDSLNRRDFGKLTLAAFGGVLAGSLAGEQLLAAEKKAAEGGFSLKDPHICCGLNTCKGHGKSAKNDCAGMGSCATVAAHGCSGTNACAGQGQTGTNSCKGQGSCGVPVSGDSWKQARASFETAMKKAGKKFGPAPKE
ncbi:MAG TPA: hypothetical protein VGR07_24380, partial [Thermoanaerobaculia bacterium]|nr:hypothetical protein [Thermoanaerobaculia bacterium]